jgi:hypothetical protein
MKKKTESEKQAEIKALEEFVHSFDKSGRPKTLPSCRWPRNAGRETETHRYWRGLAQVLKRFELWWDAGLGELPEEKSAFRRVLALERAAFERMRAEQRRAQIAFDTAKRKTPPTIV